jgi:hypothetical protein
MKKFFLPILFTLILSFPAMASRARVLTMGSGDPTGHILDPNGNGGSFYYDSTYSVFFNPAYATSNADQFLLEKSNNPRSTAQGGIFKSIGPVKTGLFLGRGSDTRFFTRANEFRPIEVLAAFGNEQMSVGLLAEHFESVLNRKRDYSQKARAGMSFKLNNEIAIDPFASIKVRGRERSHADDIRHREHSLGFRASYQQVRFFSAYRNYVRKWGPSKVEEINEGYGFALSHQAANVKKTQIYYGTGYWRRTQQRRTIVPIFLAAEHGLLSWLTLRGGLDYHLWNMSKSTSLSDNTTGRFGLTASYENFAFDWVVGSNTHRAGAGTAVDEEASQIDTQSFGFDGAFFTAAAIRVTF